jgi:hypothetical protein
MIGREAPLDFFRRSGLHVRGDWAAHYLDQLSSLRSLLRRALSLEEQSPAGIPGSALGESSACLSLQRPESDRRAGGKIAEWSNRETNLLYTVKRGLGKSLLLLHAHLLRVRAESSGSGVSGGGARRTVKWQTVVLICSQWIRIFILPEIILPWMGRNGFFEPGHPLRWLADQLFESYDGSPGHERAYWRAYGFILAFPLNVYNVFTDHPLWLWLGISFMQTFVIIPLIIFAGGRGLTAAGSAPAARSPRRWAIRSARRCRMGRSGIGSIWLARPRSYSRQVSSACASPVGHWGRVVAHPLVSQAF